MQAIVAPLYRILAQKGREPPVLTVSTIEHTVRISILKPSGKQLGETEMPRDGEEYWDG